MTRRRASEGEPAVLVQNLGARMREVGGRDGTIGQDARRQTGQRRLHAGVATRLKGIREGPALGLAAKAVCALTCVCVCGGGAGAEPSAASLVLLVLCPRHPCL